jgi:nucleotide-binding universal stress UspA family protein
MNAKTLVQQPILVPVDFSPHSEAALLFASELATALHRSLVVLHVVHDPGEAPGFYAGKPKKKKRLRKMEDVASEMMDEFLREIVEKYPKSKVLKHAETMLKVGLPVSTILDIAKKIKASMVVMGSQGRTGLKHILLGTAVRLITFYNQ